MNGVKNATNLGTLQVARGTTLGRPSFRLDPAPLISLGANICPPPPASSLVSRDVPHWDSELRVLTFRGRIFKHFRQPAPNQEIILAAFEESGWPEHIDDPISPHGEVDPKQRLHFTIWRLNRNQKHELLSFFGDGTGEGVCWAPVAERLSVHNGTLVAHCGKKPAIFVPSNGQRQ